MERAKWKFNLTIEEQSDWEELTSKVARQWSHLLEEDDDQSVLWVDFSINGQEDPALVFRCDTNFTVSCVQYYAPPPNPLLYSGDPL